MPEVAVSEETTAKLTAFKAVVEVVLEQEMDLEDCADVVLSLGIDRMLADIVGSVEATTLVASFQQLGSRYPEQVYSFVAEMIRGGAQVRAREELRRQIGIEKRRSKP